VLGSTDRDRLERRIAERERATGTQVAIAMFPSLEGESVEDVSIKLAEKWRVGQKGLDNGVIIVVFVKERKLRLEVGYGLEAVIPDVVAGQIIREVIAPKFRGGQYAPGLEAAVDAIYARAQGIGATPTGRRAPDRRSLPVVGFVVLLGVVALILGMEAMRSRRYVERQSFTGGRHGWSGPVILPWGGGGGGFSSGGGGGDGGFSGGGGGFGGGGASGDW
jgi:uncharacterized protein